VWSSSTPEKTSLEKKRGTKRGSDVGEKQRGKKDKGSAALGWGTVVY